MKKSFYITFGSDHLGGNGLHKYAEIIANDMWEARQIAAIEWGNHWCTSYSSPEDAGIEKWGLEKYVTMELVRTY